MIKSFTPSLLAVAFTFLCCPAGNSAGFILDRGLSAAPQVVADSSHYKIISKGEAAGEYQAFPDATRLKNGEIVAVFYAGDSHVTRHSAQYPKAGRLCMVRSKDEGRTWSAPEIIYDDLDDNRDPHISQLRDGSLIVSFFSLTFDAEGSNKYIGLGPRVIKSSDNGKTWGQPTRVIPAEMPYWYCSAQVREMPDGTLILPVYFQDNSTRTAFGGVVHSHDKGQTWEKVIPIGKEANKFLPAETELILLKDGTLFAALRGGRVNMHYATSKDQGKTWTPVQDIGFRGHAPSFTRLTSGEILLTIRAFPEDNDVDGYTGLRVSRDEGKTWEGPYLVDKSLGAYASTVELKDKSVLVVYYEEGKGSAVRAVRFEKPKKSHGKKFSGPQPIKALVFN